MKAKQVLLISALIIILIINSSCTSRVDHVPYVVNAAPDLFTEEWIIDVKDRIVSSLIISGGNIIVQTSEEILALNPESGEVIWSMEIKGEDKNKAPISNGDILVVAEETGNLIAIDNKSGQVIWRDTYCTTGSRHFDCLGLDDMIITDGYVISARFDEELVAYELSTGIIHWKHDLGNKCNDKLISYVGKIYYLCLDELIIIDIDSGDIEKNILIDGYDGLYLIDNELVLMRSIPVGGRTILDRYNPDSFDLLNTINLVKNNRGYGSDILCESNGNYYLSVNGLYQVDFSNGKYRQILESERLSCPIEAGNYLLVRKWTGNYLLVDPQTQKLMGSLGEDVYTLAKDNPIDPVLYENWIFAPIGINHVIALSINSK
jgi:outer membrane protein assembly factor BamB